MLLSLVFAAFVLGYLIVTFPGIPPDDDKD
jgi:hypothetical protein